MHLEYSARPSEHGPSHNLRAASRSNATNADQTFKGHAPTSLTSAPGAFCEGLEHLLSTCQCPARWLCSQSKTHALDFGCGTSFGAGLVGAGTAAAAAERSALDLMERSIPFLEGAR